MTEPILQEKQPQRFEGRNIRTPKRSGATNDIYLVQFEITREAWEALELVPKNALLEGVIWFHYGDHDEEARPEKKKRKEPEPKGPHGKYWEAMVKATVFNRPDLWLVLGVDNPVDASAALRKEFNVTSRTFISPPDFEAWCERKELTNLITVSRNVEAA